jgi:excisionase family DNA binding protein
MDRRENTEATPTEAARLTGYSAGHIRWLARHKKIKYRRIGERVLLIDVQSLLEHAEKMRELGTAKHSPS